MSEPIKVGDLVQVVRPTICCGSDERIGEIFIAGKIESCVATCIRCGEERTVLQTLHHSGWWDPLSRLKRIPPLPELEGEKRDEEITA